MATVVETLRTVDTESTSVYRSAQPVVTFVEAQKLAAEHGTPLLVVSKSALLRNFRAMEAALPGVELFYAAKANPADPILRTLCEAGGSVDVCSWGEMQAALKAGFTPDRMIHTHPCKTASNMAHCYNAGLRWFTYDNVNEIPKVAPYARDIKMLLRTAVSSTTSVINLSAKFGASEHDALHVMLKGREAGLNVKGISFHVGSQCRSPDDYHLALMQTRRIWDKALAHGFELEVLDFGGGMPAPYRESVLSLDAFSRSLQQSLEITFGDVQCRVIGEPGRGMCADTVTLITRVIGKSLRHGMPWYFLDDGVYGSFSGQVFDHTEFPLLAWGADDRETSACVVAGPTCDSSDVVCRDQKLPDLEIGELLLVPTMGAYTSASASPFNGLDVAKTIAVD